MVVKDLSVNTFWKGELRIKGNVYDEDKVYEARIDIKGSQVYDYSCSCVGGVSARTMCDHCQALYQIFKNQSSQLLAVPVVTSMEVQKMVRQYTAKEMGRLKNKGREKVVLYPKVTLFSKELQLSFSLGMGRMYTLKNLTAFVDQIQRGEHVSYGKSLEFYHHMEAFAPESRDLLLLLTDMVLESRENLVRQKGHFSGSGQELRQMTLSKFYLDRFFQTMEGQLLEVVYQNKSRKVLCRRENARFSIAVKKEGRDGYRICFPQDLSVYVGSNHLYVVDHECFYQCDELYLERLSIFIQTLHKDYGFVHELTVNRKDMPLFYQRVLKGLEQLGLIKWVEIDPDTIKPEPSTAKFHFDSETPYSVTMKPTLAYGNHCFDPLSDDDPMPGITRDPLWEFEISRVIQEYFQYKNPEQTTLVIQEDDKAIYRLLTEGMEAFMAVGEVFLSQSFRQLQILPPPKVSLGVRVTDHWLSLTIDTEGLEGVKLHEILTAYKEKRGFFRMKNGQFLSLGEDGCLTVSRLMDELALGKKQLEEKEILIPKYRAFYLDSLIKQGQDMTYNRDQMFKSMIRAMKAVEDSDFLPPLSLQQVLRGYQKVGYRWLKTLDAYGFGGILADDMGLGKTIQVIALLLDEKQHQEQHQEQQPLSSLIICPASLIYNWESEIANFAPELSTVVVAGNQTERSQMLGQIKPGQIVITSYDLLKRDRQLYEGMGFRFQVIDEAQYIKNPQTLSAKAVKSIEAVTRLALTGTPIENRLSELWSIFDYLMPGFLFSYQRFQREFELAIVRDQSQVALSRLHRMIGPFILRRLKKDVLKDLPDKMETVLYSKMELAQKQLYGAGASLLKQQLEAGGGNLSGEGLQILAQLTKLRQICCDPSLCYEDYTGGSAKLETCMQLITSAVEGEHKILLFSQFTSMLEIIGKRLQKEGIAYYQLTGSTSKQDRMAMVSAFQEDRTPLFLISLKAGGTGLNLTAADLVIHYDPWWNLAAQNQATDRAHRIGQQKQVTVFKLITKHTIEENILNLQEAKGKLTEQVLTEGEISFGSLSREDLLTLLGEG